MKKRVTIHLHNLQNHQIRVKLEHKYCDIWFTIFANIGCGGGMGADTCYAQKHLKRLEESFPERYFYYNGLFW